MAVQFIKSARRGKPVTWYIYAFRGGPLIRKVEQPRKPTLTKADHTAIAAALADDRSVNPQTFCSIIRKWCPANPQDDDNEAKASPEWRALARSTRRNWRGHIDLIENRWGKFPTAIWNDPRMVAKVVKWRDERAKTPRSADVGVTVLSVLLEFARLRGYIAINVAREIPNLYKGGDRGEIVWTADDIAKFEAKAHYLKRPHLIDALRLAAVTGLRREDLVSLTWDQIGEFAIVKKALKRSRGKRRRAVIPLTPQLETVLADLRTRPRASGVSTVLVNTRGRPWTGDGLGGSFNRIRDAADIVHIDEDGNRRLKHLHDVRGTFCTMLLTEWELTDQEAADVMSWSPERVASIRKVYVDHKRVVVALAERIAAKQVAKQSGATGRK
ncbi:phage integrase family protein [Hephaestia caeni]|uniref:Phage integrase family protein n=1 Tax=Hephaestia caeni TaxID=645617 RepID=A0A397NVT5_9SPHN|nr:site-specific integrase [Hephaestia caeni]RIA37511.1 phage integrase family protein [Hephaestia caeni]